ncbi:hypothetical protein OQA88_8615 [Cercophora sp. LCS_1]
MEVPQQRRRWFEPPSRNQRRQDRRQHGATVNGGPVEKTWAVQELISWAELEVLRVKWELWKQKLRRAQEQAEPQTRWGIVISLSDPDHAEKVYNPAGGKIYLAHPDLLPIPAEAKEEFERIQRWLREDLESAKRRVEGRLAGGSAAFDVNDFLLENVKLRMSGRVEGNRVEISPTIWIYCSKEQREEMKRELHDPCMERAQSTQFGRIEVGNAMFVSSDKSSGYTKPVGPGVVLDGDGLVGITLHLEIEELPEGSTSTNGFLCRATLMKGGEVVSQKLSIVGGLVSIENNTLGLTSAHGILGSLWGRDGPVDRFRLSQGSSSTQIHDLGHSTSADNQATVQPSEDNHNRDGGLAPSTLASPSTAPSVKWRAVDLRGGANFAGLKASPTGHADTGPSSLSLSRDETTKSDFALMDVHLHHQLQSDVSSICFTDPVDAGPVEIRLGPHGAIQGTLLTEPGELCVFGVPLSTQLVRVPQPLQPGSSGAWVVRDNVFCGIIIAGFDHEPYAHMIPAGRLVADIEQSLPDAPTVDLPANVSLDPVAPIQPRDAPPIPSAANLSPRTTSSQDQPPSHPPHVPPPTLQPSMLRRAAVLDFRKLFKQTDVILQGIGMSFYTWREDLSYSLASQTGSALQRMGITHPTWLGGFPQAHSHEPTSYPYSQESDGERTPTAGEAHSSYLRSFGATHEIPRSTSSLKVVTGVLDRVKSLHKTVLFTACLEYFAACYNLFSLNLAAAVFDFLYEPRGYTRTLLLSALPALVGILVGSLSSGVVAGRIGVIRTSTMFLVCLLIGIIGLSTVNIDSTFIIALVFVWQFVMGLGIGSASLMPAIIVTEYSPTHSRLKALALVLLMQPLAQAFAYGIGVACLTETISMYYTILDVVSLDGYEPVVYPDEIQVILAAPTRRIVETAARIVVGFGAAPVIATLLHRLNALESPRFLFEVKREYSRAYKTAVALADIARDWPYSENPRGFFLWQPSKLSSMAPTSNASPSIDWEDGAPPSFKEWLHSFWQYLRQRPWKSQPQKKRPTVLVLLFLVSACWCAVNIVFYGLGLDNPQTIGSVWSYTLPIFSEIPMPAYETTSFYLPTGAGTDLFRRWTTVLALISGPGVVAVITRFYWVRYRLSRVILLNSFAFVAVILFVIGVISASVFGNTPASPARLLTAVMFALTQFTTTLAPAALQFAFAAEIFTTRYRAPLLGIASALSMTGPIAVRALAPTVLTSIARSYISLLALAGVAAVGFIILFRSSIPSTAKEVPGHNRVKAKSLEEIAAPVDDAPEPVSLVSISVARP